MSSEDDNDRGSSSGGDGGGGIIHHTSATTIGNAPPPTPWGTQPAPNPDRPSDLTPTTTHMAAPDDNHHVNVALATLIARPPHDDDVGPSPSSPPLSLSEGTQVEAPDGHECAQSSIFMPIDEETDEAPLPSEMIAASFEDDANKSGLIDEYNCAPDLEGELPRGEAEAYDEAPIPPETMAAAFEKQRDEEENQEGSDDDDAPCSPELIAASYEAMDSIVREVMKKSAQLNEDNTNRPVPEGQIASLHDIKHLDERNSNETPEKMNDPEVHLGPSLLSDQRRNINVEDASFSFTPTTQGGNDAIFAGSSQGHVEIQHLTTEVTMTQPQPSFDPYYQSLPLLEATLFQDVPNEPVYIYVNTNSREEEPVYDAFPLTDTQDNTDVRGWSRKNNKTIILGLVLVAIAAIITVVVVTAGRPNDTPSLPITTSTTSTTMPITFNVYMDEMKTSAPSTAPLTWKQQGAAILGKDDEDFLGSSVAMSKNSKTMVIGADENGNYTGYVEVYHAVDDDENWTRLGETIYGNAAYDSFGMSVDITTDGKTIVCGSPGYHGASVPGYVRVFKLVSDSEIDTDTWVQIGQNITGEASGDEFGFSVSISDDGETIAIGAPGNAGTNGEESGHVRIYHLDDDGRNWKKIGDDIDGDAAKDWLGLSVSLSANGTIVVIGATWAGVNRTGGVKVFRIDNAGSSWEQLGESIYGDNYRDVFGYSVDISHDGNIVAIGSLGYDGLGYVRVFSLEGRDNIGIVDWKQIGQVITGEAIGDVFGCSVSLSDDGETIAISAFLNNGINGEDSGHVQVYRMYDSESDWKKLGEDIVGEVANEQSGYAVSLSGDGDTVAIGSPYYFDHVNGMYVGQVRVFSSSW